MTQQGKLCILQAEICLLRQALGRPPGTRTAQCAASQKPTQTTGHHPRNRLERRSTHAPKGLSPARLGRCRAASWCPAWTDWWSLMRV